MAKMKKLTPEDEARFAETTRRAQERIAYQRAKAEEEEARAAAEAEKRSA